MHDQQPVADLITQVGDGAAAQDGKPAEPKTIKNYFGVIKAVVASAKDKGTRKQLFPVVWDNDVLLMPRVNPKKQLVRRSPPSR